MEAEGKQSRFPEMMGLGTGSCSVLCYLPDSRTKSSAVADGGVCLETGHKKRESSEVAPSRLDFEKAPEAGAPVNLSDAKSSTSRKSAVPSGSP